MATGAPVHAAYPRHTATDDRAALPIGMVAVIAVATLKATEVIVPVPVVSERRARIVDTVGGRRRMRVGHLGHGCRRIMGTVRAEGNNTTHRKVCSTSHCGPDESRVAVAPPSWSNHLAPHALELT